LIVFIICENICVHRQTHVWVDVYCALFSIIDYAERRDKTVEIFCIAYFIIFDSCEWKYLKYNVWKGYETSLQLYVLISILSY
jgi:hypothetical protein